MKKVFKLYLMLFLSITGTVFTTNAETKKILVVGNSFSFDAALQEFLPIVQAAGDDIVLGFPYKGGTTLELHTNYITTNQQIYNYYKIKDGKMTDPVIRTHILSLRMKTGILSLYKLTIIIRAHIVTIFHT